MNRRRLPIIIGLLLIALCFIASAHADTVLARKRLGNNSEGITTVVRGQVATIVVMDGYDVFSIDLGRKLRPAAPGGACDPANPAGNLGCSKLFDVRALGIGPRGIAYVTSQDRFYFSGFDPTKLYVTTSAGVPLPPLAVQYLPGTDPADISQFESLTYIPADAALFPDTIAAITLHGASDAAHIQIMGLDGIVQREIVFPAASPLFNTYVTGLAYSAPDRFLLSPLGTTPSEVYQTTFDGAITEHVLTVPQSQGGLEGLTTLADGRIFGADYISGMLYAFDGNFQHVAADDRVFKLGFGISRSQMAWDPDTSEFLVSNADDKETIFAVGDDLAHARRVMDLTGTPLFGAGLGGLSYIPGESRIAVSVSRNPGRGVGFFDANTGVYQSRLSLTEPAFPLADWHPTGVTILPGNLVGLRVQNVPLQVRVVTRTGTPLAGDPTAIVPTALAPIALSAAPGGGGLAISNPPDGPELAAGASFYDLAGNRTRSINTASIGAVLITSIAPITTGRFLGNYAAMDGDNSELIVFSSGCDLQLTANPSVIWPPNHKFVTVRLSASPAATCAAPVTCQIASVSSNQPANGPGDGNTSQDWAIQGLMTVSLRAERSGTLDDDRIYTILVDCTDGTGRTSRRSVAVSVPHNQ